MPREYQQDDGVTGAALLNATSIGSLLRQALNRVSNRVDDLFPLNRSRWAIRREALEPCRSPMGQHRGDGLPRGGHRVLCQVRSRCSCFGEPASHFLPTGRAGEPVIMREPKRSCEEVAHGRGRQRASSCPVAMITRLKADRKKKAVQGK